jgi:hypothetical protein
MIAAGKNALAARKTLKPPATLPPCGVIRANLFH